MKQTILFLTTLILIAGFCKSQTASVAITGNYIGQSAMGSSVMTIEIKQNQKYVLKTYDPFRKVQKKIKGKWTLDGDKLVLKEKSGAITVLKKYNDIWYITDKSERVCLARFYQNRDPEEFWTELR